MVLFLEKTLEYIRTASIDLVHFFNKKRFFFRISFDFFWSLSLSLSPLPHLSVWEKKVGVVETYFIKTQSNS